MIKKKRSIQHFLLSLIGVVLFLGVVAYIDIKGNLANADETSKVLLDEVVNIFKKDEVEEEILIDSLKEDYITRAKAIAYILQKNEDFSVDIGELKKLANYLNVDEIHLFDTTGTIIGGTVPKYYGYSFDSGEQMAYFEPMLDDKSLSMCQDVSPNTAEGKAMMYAIVWRDDQKGMVQVGINPERLLNEMNHHEISEVVNSMPMTEGVSIIVASTDDDRIYGATDNSVIGKTLPEIGIAKSNKWDEAHVEKINDSSYRVIFTEFDGMAIGVLYSMKVANKGLASNLLMVLGYVCLCLLIVFIILSTLEKNKNAANAEIEKSRAERDTQLEILRSMSEMYISMHYIDLVNNTISEYEASEAIKSNIYETDNIAELVKHVMTMRSSEESRESILEFTDINTIVSRMQNVKFLFQDFINIDGKWARASFVSIVTDEEGYPQSLIYAVQPIDEAKRRERALIQKTRTDELTDFLNRRAYDEDVKEMTKEGIPEDLVLVSMDVNGLKNVNDTLGHAAGDELLSGATSCMRKIFSKYGEVYRTGGDEFIALLKVSGEDIEDIIRDFETVTENWRGSMLSELSVSCGYIQYRDDMSRSIAEMEILADKQMYLNKSAHYSKLGVDRRTSQM